MRKTPLAVIGTAFLLGTGVSSAAAQNIVANPGFETGNFGSWTQFGNPGFTGVTCGGGAHSGSCSAFFGPVGSVGGIFQTLITTIGDTYTFSFWDRTDGLVPSFFDAWWNGASVFAVTNPGASGFTNHSFSVLATSAATDIRFFFRDDIGFLDFDDVSVVDAGPSTVTPEPASMTLLATGLLGLAGAGMRKRRTRKA